MTVLHAPNVTDKFTTHLIRRIAKGLVEEGTFRRSDLDDVMQDLRLALIQQAADFDPEKSRWSTFVNHIVKKQAISLRRRQLARCRHPENEISSLNSLIPAAEGRLAELGATVCEEEYRTAIGQDFVDHTDRVELALDTQAVLDSMPGELREICEQLKYYSQVEVMKNLGISRTTMQRRLAELKEYFEEAGLGKND